MESLSLWVSDISKAKARRYKNSNNIFFLLNNSPSSISSFDGIFWMDYPLQAKLHDYSCFQFYLQFCTDVRRITATFSSSPKPLKNISQRPMMPAGYPKRHATPGDHHGTFGGLVEYFSGKAKPKPRYVKPKPNFLTSPGKKGGPGYPNICLSKYPEHTWVCRRNRCLVMKPLTLKERSLPGKTED